MTAVPRSIIALRFLGRLFMPMLALLVGSLVIILMSFTVLYLLPNWADADTEVNAFAIGLGTLCLAYFMVINLWIGRIYIRTAEAYNLPVPRWIAQLPLVNIHYLAATIWFGSIE